MQIVIEISERDYELMKASICKSSSDFIILNGTSLPKGHGRLIDADEMKTMKNIQSANFNAVELIRLWIDNQQTIIEADTESEE